MKTQISKFIMIALLLTGFTGCSSCNRNPKSNEIPKSLDGFVLYGTVTSGDGVFKDLAGYAFSTKFDKDRTFITESSGKTESRGDYSYTRLDDRIARLTLIARSTEHSGEQIEVTLTFDTPTKGTFLAHHLSDRAGEQKGSFEITQP